MLIKVLDHGFVRYVEHMGSDLSIVRAARVSHQAEWRTGEDAGKDEKLIRYMMNNKHTSPFESVIFTFEIKAPIFVFRQWHRHRTWSYNEVSARYSVLPDEYYIPDPEQVGVQSNINKQARDTKLTNPKAAKAFRRALRNHCDVCFERYQAALTAGVPRELARCFLGVNTYSRMFATVDLHNLFHFLRLRLHEHAQYEIRVYAQAILKIIEKHVPVAVAAFLDK